MTGTTASVSPLGGARGVRIEGVDVANDSRDQLVVALRAILDEHLVIHLPGQADLGPDALLEFAARWGEIGRHPSLP